MTRWTLSLRAIGKTMALAAFLAIGFGLATSGAWAIRKKGFNLLCRGRTYMNLNHALSAAIGAVIVVFALLPPQSANAETAYTITTVTGKTGTNAHIVVKLHGTDGSFTTWSKPLDTPGRDDFEPGRTDVFTLHNQVDIGVITDVELKGTGRGLHTDPWEMKSMSVSSNGPKSKSRTTSFKYSEGLINQWKIDADNPKTKSLMLRANNLPDPRFTSAIRIVDLQDLWVAYGSLSRDLPYKEEVTFSREDLASQGVDVREKIATENEISLSVQGPVGVATVTASYRFKLATEHEKLRKESRQVKRLKSATYPVDVPANTILFVKLKYQERRMYGTLQSSSLLDQEERYVVIEEIIRPAGGESITFKFVDEVKDGRSFASLWKDAKGDTPVPLGPKKPVAAQATPVVAPPVVAVQPTAEPSRVRAPVSSRAPEENDTYDDGAYETTEYGDDYEDEGYEDDEGDDYEGDDYEEDDYEDHGDGDYCMSVSTGPVA